MNTVYAVKGYINGHCYLSRAYKKKGAAQNSWEKRVRSACYDRVELVLQNAVYFDETALVLREWNA